MRIYKVLLILIIFHTTQSCAPLLGGLGAVAIGGATKEKGIGTAFNDSIIKVNILNAFYKWDKNIADDLKIVVENGSVLLTGKVKKSKQKIKLTKISWGIRGVKEVNNKIQISDVSNVKNIARDIASVGEIRAKLLANSEINSLNFSIDVVNDAAYLSGIASSENEMNLVTNIAQGARFVKEVFNYIKINPDKR